MRKDNIQVVSKALRIYFIAAALMAVIGLLVLFWIPADPKYVWFIGYSKNRLALIAIFILFTISFAYLALKSYRDRHFNQVLAQKTIDVVTKYRYILLVMMPIHGLTFFLVFVYFFLQIRYLANTTYQVAFGRLLPLIVFGSSLFIMTYLVVILISIRFPAFQPDIRTLYINPKKVFVFLLSVTILLVFLSTALILLSLLDIPVSIATIKLFNLNTERNIPTLFSSVILLSSSILLGLIAYLTRSTGGPYGLFWAVLSLGFLYLSIDEAAFIHENFSEETGGWVFVAAPFVIIFILGYIRFFLHLPRSTKLYFLFAGVLYLGGALVLEFIGSWRINIPEENVIISTIAFFTVEESLEMFAIVLFIYSLLLYLRDHFPEMNLSIQNPDR